MPVDPVNPVPAVPPATRMAAAAVRGLLRLPHRTKRALAGPAIHRDGNELDLDAQLLLRITRALPRPEPDPVRLRTQARRMAAIGAGRRAPVRVDDTTVAGFAGPLRARLYDPGAADALLVYFHGGGWVIGDLDTHDGLCRTLAHTAGIRVVAVDYRLAPEHPYPAAIDDAAAAFRDIVGRADEFAVAPERVGVGGDSAGGHLAAVLCQRMRRDGGPAPLLQLLIYPPTDLTGKAESRKTFAEGFALTKADIDFFDRCFLPPDLDRTQPDVSPLRAETTAGLPRAVVITAGFDPLRDEGEAYAHRLRTDGVPVVLRRFDGYMHGFVNNALAFGPAVHEVAALLADALPGARGSSTDPGAGGERDRAATGPSGS
ncbi:alpha/beta hydrolase [Nocardia amikacinitolerans]|uniref:alpha/beta hydrolase n=1 Tax=Nocardia amikacinitolerans TaxID=756689 RepID=UPI0020A61314|nr:alpha/beta hydrolase [Nocardia amikacinitolerans]MCP2288348.1 acetyl esterase [Nocardia amikacinitolerans]